MPAANVFSFSRSFRVHSVASSDADFENVTTTTARFSARSAGNIRGSPLRFWVDRCKPAIERAVARINANIASFFWVGVVKNWLVTRMRRASLFPHEFGWIDAKRPQGWNGGRGQAQERHR